MNAFERIILYYSRAIKHWNALWFFHIFADTLLVIFARDYWYLVSIIVLGDLIRLAANGAWYCAKKHDTAKRNPAKDVIIYALLPWKSGTASFAAVMAASDSIAVVSTILYILVAFNTIETIRRVLLVMQKFDATWLKNTEGKIGIANWLSISRIGASIVLPHLFWVRPYGGWNATVELVLLGICFATDAIDGRIARKCHMETRAGRYLDPLGDKVLFVPLAIAFALMTGRFGFTGTKACYGVVTIVCAFIAIVRDILFFIWFFTWRKKGPQGMRAGNTDKVRMVAICLWLGAMAIAYAADELENAASASRFAGYGFFLVMAVAVISFISLFVDIKRFNKAKKETIYT